MFGNIWGETPRRPFQTQKICPSCAESCDGVDDDGYPTCSVCDDACQTDTDKTAPRIGTNRVLNMGGISSFAVPPVPLTAMEEEVHDIARKVVGDGSTTARNPDCSSSAPDKGSHLQDISNLDSGRAILNEKQQVSTPSLLHAEKGNVGLVPSVRSPGSDAGLPVRSPVSDVGQYSSNASPRSFCGSVSRQSDGSDLNDMLKRQIIDLETCLSAKSSEADKLREVLRRTRAVSYRNSESPTARSHSSDSEKGSARAAGMEKESTLKRAKEEAEGLRKKCAELEEGLRVATETSKTEAGKLQRLLKFKDSELQTAEERSGRELSDVIKGFTSRLDDMQSSGDIRVMQERAAAAERQTDLNVAIQREAQRSEELGTRFRRRERLLAAAMTYDGGDSSRLMAEMEEAIECEETSLRAAITDNDLELEVMQEANAAKERSLICELSDARAESANWQKLLASLKNELSKLWGGHVDKESLQALRTTFSAEWEGVRAKVEEAESIMSRLSREVSSGERDVAYLTGAVREHDDLIAELHDGQSMSQQRMVQISEETRRCEEVGDAPGVTRNRGEMQQEDMCMVVFDKALIEAMDISKANAQQLQTAYTNLEENKAAYARFEKTLDAMSRDLAAMEARGKQEVEAMQAALERKRGLEEQISQAEWKIESLHVVLTGKTKELDSVRERGAVQLAELRRHKDACEAGLKASVEDLRRIRDDFSAKGRQYHASGEALREELEKKAAEAIEMRLAAEQARKMIESLNRQCDELKQGLNNAVSSGKADAERLGRELSERDDEIQTLVKTLADMDRDLQDAEASSQGEINDLIKSFKTRQEEVLAAKENELRQLHAVIKNHEVESEASRTRRLELEESLASNAVNIERLQGEMADKEAMFEAHVKILKSQIDEDAAKLQSTVWHLEERLASERLASERLASERLASERLASERLASAISDRDILGDKAMKKARAERDDAIEELRTVAEEREEISMALDSTTAQLRDAERALEGVQTSLETSAGESRDLQNRIALALAERDALKCDLVDVEACLERAEAHVKKQEDLLAAASHDAETLERQVETLERQVVDAHVSIEEANEEATILRKKLAAALAQRDALQSDLEYVQAALDQAGEGIKKQEGKTASAESERDALAASFAELQVTMSVSNSKSEELSGEAAALKAALQSATAERDALQVSVESLRSTVSVLQSQRDSRKGEVGHLQASISMLEASITALQSERDSLQEDNDDLEHAVSYARKELDSVRDKFEGFMQESEMQHEEATRGESEAFEKLQLTEAEFAAARTEFAAREESFTSSIDKLQALLNVKGQECIELWSEVKALCERGGSQESKIRGLLLRLEETEPQLEGARCHGQILESGLHGALRELEERSSKETRALKSVHADALESLRREKEDACQTLRRQVESREGTIAEVREHVAQSAGQLAAVDRWFRDGVPQEYDGAENATLRADIAALRRDLVCEKEWLVEMREGEVPRLKQELADADRAKTDLANQYGAVQEEMRQQEAALTQLKKEFGEMRLQLEGKDDQVKKLARELETRDAACNKAVKELEAKEEECEQAKSHLAAAQAQEGEAVDVFEDKVRQLEQNVKRAEQRSVELKRQLEDKNKDLDVVSKLLREASLENKVIKAEQSRESPSHSAPATSPADKAKSGVETKGGVANGAPRAASNGTECVAVVSQRGVRVNVFSVGLAVAVTFFLLALWSAMQLPRVIPRIG